MDQVEIPIEGQARGRGRRGRGRGRGRVGDPIFQGAIDIEVNQHVPPPVVPPAPAAAPFPGAVPAPVPAPVPVPPAPFVYAAPVEDDMQRIARLVETVQKMRVEEFVGTTNPLEADDWLRTLLKTFELLRTPELDRLSCVSFLLQSDADIWWTDVKERQVDQTVITWDFFLEQFRSYYMPRVYREQKVREFLSLGQGEMTVEEYRAQFQQLSRYATSLIPSEEDKCRRFIDGLHPHIRKHVAVLSFTGFHALVGSALEIERVLIDEAGGMHGSLGKRTRQDAFSSGGGGKFFKKGGNSSASQGRAQNGRAGGRSQQNQQSQRSAWTLSGTRGGYIARGGYSYAPYCGICGRGHHGPCTNAFESNVCYYCKQPGHFRRECPYLSHNTQQMTDASSQGIQRGGYAQRGQRGGYVRGGRTGGTNGGRGGGRQTQDQPQGQAQA